MPIEYINPNGIKIYLSEFKWIEKQKVRDAINKLLIGNKAIELLGMGIDTETGNIYLNWLKKELGL